MKSSRSIRWSTVVFCAILVGIFCVSICSGDEGEGIALPALKEFRIERKITEEAKECIDCHATESKGIAADWADSRHAHSNITCIDCHGASVADADVSKEHLEYDKTRISSIVSPKDCSRCHPGEAAEYDRSKHANTLEIIQKIDPWLNHGMNNEVERTTGCYYCHGTKVAFNEDGDLDKATWPNVGVGRANPVRSLNPADPVVPYSRCFPSRRRHRRQGDRDAGKSSACGPPAEGTPAHDS